MASDLGSYLPWHISGSYLEACNCEAICPCRRIGGRQGGRSTYGVCLGSLSWQIEEGDAGRNRARGDAQPCWRTGTTTTRRARRGVSSCTSTTARDERQREALEGIFLGRLGGTPEVQFPWVWKPSALLGVRQVAIEIDHTPGRGWFRAGGQVSVRVREPVQRAGARDVRDPRPRQVRARGRRGPAQRRGRPARVRAHGKCGYEATFDYSSSGRLAPVESSALGMCSGARAMRRGESEQQQRHAAACALPG